MSSARAIVLLLVVMGCAAPEGERAAGEDTAAPAAAGVPAGTRTLGELGRTAMLEVLLGETGEEKKVWFAIGPGDRETAALKNAFAAVFAEAGWEIHTDVVTGMVLRPGLMFLMAETEEQSAPYVHTAREAIQASGLEVKAASEYRPYYEDRRRENPNYVGIAMAPEQAFAFVIGPRPTS